jgi:hypothetical protein
MGSIIKLKVCKFNQLLIISKEIYKFLLDFIFIYVIICKIYICKSLIIKNTIKI